MAMLPLVLGSARTISCIGDSVEILPESERAVVLSCAYCHLFHQSRLKQRREDWGCGGVRP